MTQIVVTLENGADSTFIRRMIENMKGVLNTSVHRQTSASSDKETEDLMAKLHSIKQDVDPSVIDMTDERTLYILSKLSVYFQHCR